MKKVIKFDGKKLIIFHFFADFLLIKVRIRWAILLRIHANLKDL